MLNPGHGDDALEISPHLRGEASLGEPSPILRLFILARARWGASREGSSPSTRVGPVRRTSSAYRVPRALTRSRGEIYYPDPEGLRARVVGDLRVGRRDEKKKIIPPARLSLLERFNKKGPEDCESFSA